MKKYELYDVSIRVCTDAAAIVNAFVPLLWLLVLSMIFSKFLHSDLDSMSFSEDSFPIVKCSK